MEKESKLKNIGEGKAHKAYFAWGKEQSW